MALTREQFEDLLEYLREHPEAREELRPIVLGQVHEAVPSRLDRIEAAVEQLASDLAEQGRRLNQVLERVDEVTLRLHRLTERLDHVIDTLENNNRMLGKYQQLDGRLLEAAYARNVLNWFHRRLRRPRVTFLADEPRFLEAVESGVISEDEDEDVHLLDLLVVGEAGNGTGPQYYGCEISSRIAEEDVERAARRVAILRKADLDAVALVGGSEIDDRAEALAGRSGVVVDIRKP